ncbi:MAG: ergothioneine biosynthesis protein EgtC [Gammaproteobacteria bacterium]
MCRLAAYAGPPLLLDRLLLAPEHSLYKQSYAPKEMQNALLNADGFGVGWYDDHGKIRSYTRTLPIWSDHNLPHLAASLEAGMWLGNVRSATLTDGVSEANTQPFCHGQLMFMHNGYLQGFNRDVREHFHERLSAGICASLHGNTDSEYLFALVRQYLQEQGDNDLATALQAAVAEVDTWLAGRQALHGIIVSDGKQLVVLRQGMRCLAPSLYWTNRHPDFPDALVVASERFDDDTSWQPVTEDLIMAGSAGQPLEQAC